MCLFVVAFQIPIFCTLVLTKSGNEVIVSLEKHFMFGIAAKSLVSDTVVSSEQAKNSC